MPIQMLVRLPHENGLSRDSILNTFAFTGIPDLTNCMDAATYVEAFYNATSGTNPISEWIGGSISRTEPCVIKCYDIGAPEPRTPILEVDFTLGDAGNESSLPHELAVVSSIRAEYVSGQEPKRRRGRFYIGPLVPAANSASSNNDARPNSVLIQDLVESTRILALAGALTSNTLGVWSRVDGVVRPVVAGWVDNAFDVQRRRGTDPDVRSNWTTGV